MRITWFGLSMVGLGTLLMATAPTVAELTASFQSLEEAMAAAGFRPAAPRSFTVVFTADVHYGYGDPERILPPVLEEIHAMKVPPRFFGIVGDLICKASLQFGQVPGPRQKEEAIEEFQLLRKSLRRLPPGIPVKLALGNHDTYPGEDKPVLFHTVFPEHPEYFSFDIEGVHFVFLNGGSSGYLDPEQRRWFRDDIRQHHPPGATLVVVCHQPSLGSITAERGITEAFREALADCEGDLWMVAGHAHRNHDQCFKLPRGVITQATITTCNPDIWGSEHPGYWIYGFERGKLVARIFRRIGVGYAVAPPPPLERARPLLLPFEGHDDVLWKVMVGEGDKPYLIEAKAAWCLNYWHYNRYLIYRFPLSLAGGKATRFVLVESPSGKAPRRYFVSPDAHQWEEIMSVHREGSYTSFPIPQRCQEAGTLAVRIERCVVSGFALAR